MLGLYVEAMHLIIGQAHVGVQHMLYVHTAITAMRITAINFLSVDSGLSSQIQLHT